ncbi:MAG: hypothetical protein JXA30_19335 [Deltaproteobacteria bacterium]|nr:hypothetical protein [Deltaproteobacteria bacterium]
MPQAGCSSESDRPFIQGAAGDSGINSVEVLEPPPTGGTSGVETDSSASITDGGLVSLTDGGSQAPVQDDADSKMIDSEAAGLDGRSESVPTESGVGVVTSADALRQLLDHLAIPVGSRGDIESMPFAQVPLTREDAEAARAALWQDLEEDLRASRRAEHDAKSITIGDYTLRYDTVVLGSEPPGGRSLFITMHGGGNAPASANDSQWINQIELATSYHPQDALWVAPRAPTDDWNMWFKDHIDGLFDRLITNMVVFEGINSNKVYLTGYSAGGDGVYALTPRTADRWAGAAMSAGHPNGVSLANLRNVAFAIYVGANDSSYNRNTVGVEYAAKLDALQAADPGGYPHQAGFPLTSHWMNLQDQPSIPFIQGYTRDPAPNRVVWEQHPATHSRFYWLALDAGDEREGTKVIASYQGQTVSLEEIEGLNQLRVRFSEKMVDMDQPVTIVHDGNTLFEGHVRRNIAVIERTLREREDPEMAYLGELSLTLASH